MAVPRLPIDRFSEKRLSLREIPLSHVEQCEFTLDRCGVGIGPKCPPKMLDGLLMPPCLSALMTSEEEEEGSTRFLTGERRRDHEKQKEKGEHFSDIFFKLFSDLGRSYLMRLAILSHLI